MRWDTAWMMASQPPLTLTPNCKGARTERAEDRTAWARHLDTRRRRTSPTAIGRRPPFFFLQASKEAPQKWGRTDCGVRLEASRLTNFVKAKRDSRDLFTADSEIVGGVGAGPAGRVAGGT